ncbi:hypothetical protein NUU61_007584 [Penicillium alfredii]|uniref:Uncharacterized protein n=1 Tax=Penicillium alfredii TaxID=1506179 RepID=A0A9W9EQS3_9EURO|nr:uncharacterized protein NUU61_007584 [Penicillium alfredii]KAJ5086277.1 hypothetical protein NUU61_007584 [Penicillium alfredii]
MRSAPEDFESLPPAVRRKFFSNVERLRIRLAQSDHGSPAVSTPNYHRAYRSNIRLGTVHPRVRIDSSVRRRALKRPASPQKLRKPGSLHLAYLATQADSQCFHSLPVKVQQKLFSREEQRRLRLAYRCSIIADAADEACYRRDWDRFGRPSTDSLPSEATLPVAQPSTVFWESDDDDFDLMDQSLYDSVRWLDGDGDLDLSLDEYHAHVADAAVKPPSRRRSSFRRSLSLTTNPLRRRPSASISRGRPSFSPSVQPLAPLANPSASHPVSRHRLIQHGPKSSTSSIDPTAQYYQDPDARLKLRVYLASPQKFDEAVEFGFPALEQDQKENVAPEPSPPPPAPVTPEFAGTFFEDDDGTIVGSPGGSIEHDTTPRPSTQLPELPPVRETPRSSMDSSRRPRRQSMLPGPKTIVPQRLPGNREMTLKMTLTRPDLRTESPTPSESSKADPLQLAALPPADRRQHIWDTDLDEQGVVKKMWRKLRRRA